MKPVIRSFLAAIAVCSISLISCSKDEPNDNVVTGVHKITVELSSDKNFHYVIDFAGTTSTGTVKLYDGNGEYQGNNYLTEGVLNGTKKITCYTDNNGVLLVSSLSFSCDNDNEGITYSIKAYVNDKLVDELNSTFISKDGSRTKNVTVSTGVKK